MWEYGDYDPAIAEVQAALGITADGYFGPETLEAVTNFQAANGLDVDGIVGDQTMGALSSQSSGGGGDNGGGGGDYPQYSPSSTTPSGLDSGMAAQTPSSSTTPANSDWSSGGNGWGGGSDGDSSSTAPVNTFQDFGQNYQQIIQDIARQNNVSMGDAQAMLEADIRNQGKEVPSYWGGAVTSQMTKDYSNAYNNNLANLDPANAQALADAMSVSPGMQQNIEAYASANGIRLTPEVYKELAARGAGNQGAEPVYRQLAGAATSPSPASANSYPPPVQGSTTTQNNNTMAYADYIKEQNRLKSEADAKAKAELEAKRQLAKSELDKTLSTENYNALLQKVIDNLMPTYMADQTQVQKNVLEMNRKADVDAERRGLFNSGVAAEMMRKNEEYGAQALAKAMAELKANAVNNVNGQIDRQVSSIKTQGDWITEDMKLDAANRQSNIGNDVSWANIGLDETKLADQIATNAREQSRADEQLDLNRIIADRNYQIDKGNLGVSQGNLALNKQRLDNDMLQFTSEMGFKKEQADIAARQFAEQMGYNWSKLSADQQAQMQDAAIRAISANASLLNAQNDKDKLEYNKDLLNKQTADNSYKARTAALIDIQSEIAKGGPAPNVDAIKQSIIAKYGGAITPAELDSLLQIVDQQAAARNNAPSAGSTGNPYANVDYSTLLGKNPNEVPTFFEGLKQAPGVTADAWGRYTDLLKKVLGNFGK